MQNQCTTVSRQDGNWWIGYLEELPRANTQGETFDEARENLKEAVAMVLEANRKLRSAIASEKWEFLPHKPPTPGRAAGVFPVLVI